MKGPISLAQELRDIRNGAKGKNPFKRASDTGEKGQPWQSDIERMERTLREVLDAVSSLSGVKLPDVTPDSQGPGDFPSSLDIQTLKDRIRSDLEAFSATTASEITKQAKEQTRATLVALQEDLKGQVEQAAGGFRESLRGGSGSEEAGLDVAKQTRERVAELVQARTDEFARWVWLTCTETETPIPAQIEKLLEPHVERATARFIESSCGRLQEQLAEQEQLSQDLLQGMQASFSTQINILVQNAQKACQNNTDSALKGLDNRMSQASDDAARNMQGTIAACVDENLERFRGKLAEMAEAAQQGFQAQAEGFQQKLEGVAAELYEKNASELTGRIEKMTGEVFESAAENGRRQTDELKASWESLREKTGEQIREAARSAKETLSQEAEGLTGNLRGLGQELALTSERQIAASEEQLSKIRKAAVEALDNRIKQLTGAQLEKINKLMEAFQEKSAAQYQTQLQEAIERQYTEAMGRIREDAARVAAEVKELSGQVMQELSGKVNTSTSALKEEAMQTTSSIEASFKQLMESYRSELAQAAELAIDEQRQAISSSVSDLQNRLLQTAQILRGERNGGTEA